MDLQALMGGNWWGDVRDEGGEGREGTRAQVSAWKSTVVSIAVVAVYRTVLALLSNLLSRRRTPVHSPNTVRPKIQTKDQEMNSPNSCNPLIFPLTCSAHRCASSLPEIWLASVSACLTAAVAALKIELPHDHAPPPPPPPPPLLLALSFSSAAALTPWWKLRLPPSPLLRTCASVLTRSAAAGTFELEFTRGVVGREDAAVAGFAASCFSRSARASSSSAAAAAGFGAAADFFTVPVFEAAGLVEGAGAGVSSAPSWSSSARRSSSALRAIPIEGLRRVIVAVVQPAVWTLGEGSGDPVGVVLWALLQCLCSASCGRQMIKP